MEAFDAQKTRKVLKRVEKFLGILIRENLVKDAPFLGEGELENESDLADDVWEVLQMQLRNCDVGTPEEQERRFEKFCDSHKWVSDDGTNACSSDCPLYKTVDCTLHWAQMPYKAERKGEVEARGAGALKGNAGSAQ